MNLFIGVALMLALVVAELVFIRFVMREEVPYGEIVANLNSGHIVLWLFRGLEIAGYHLALSYLSLDLVTAWPAWAQWSFAFVAWDFFFYWLHRIHHHLPSLWSVHVVHHEGEHFSLSLGIRNSWFSSLTSLPFFLPLAFVGVPLEQFIICGSVNYFIQFYNHNHIVGRSGWLERVLITPSHHRVHHGHDDLYRNRNFGGTLVLWDKLFGTFQPELAGQPPTFGVTYVPSADPWRMNTTPVWRYLRRRVSAASQRTYRLPNGLIFGAGLLMFAGLVTYVYHEPNWALGQRWWPFAYLFFGTLGTGGMTEGQHWGLWVWVATAAGGAVAVLAKALYLDFPFESLLTFAVLLHAAWATSMAQGEGTATASVR